MHLSRKKKVEIVVEVARARQILQAIEEIGATGYTVIPHVSGMGHQGKRGGDDVLGVFHNVLILVITTEDVAMEVIERCQILLENYAGIVYLSDVEVVREAHF
jgi:nitrogen regulatory protein PII